MYGYFCLLQRLPLIRHLRYCWYTYQVTRWARMWGERGIGLGLMNEADEHVLTAIWEGRM